MLVNATEIERSAGMLASRIGEVFSGLYNRLAVQAKPSMAESFDIWFLEVDKLSKALDDNTLPIKKTQFRYHQIRLGKRARGYAISESSLSGSPEVILASISPVAQRMDRAIEQLETKYEDKKARIEVRLLVAPACWVYAFSLVEIDCVYLFAAPHRFKRLRRPRLLKTKMFLNLLNEELEPFLPLGKPRMRW